MQIKWTEKAHSDLTRLYDFMAPANRPAAAKVVQAIVAAPVQLLRYPRLGEKLEEFEPRDVGRILIGAYEMRYEIRSETIYILRIWHGREDR
jgi:plasmid stabilization system protein ParE